MPEYASAHLADGSTARNSLSVLFLIGAVVLIGIGLLTAFLWLVTFDWWLFLGFLPLAVGTIMLFDRRAGSNRAE